MLRPPCSAAARRVSRLVFCPSSTASPSALRRPAGLLALALAAGLCAPLPAHAGAFPGTRFRDAVAANPSGSGAEVPGPVNGAFALVTSNSYVVTSTADSGAGTLRSALDDAAANGGASIITFDTSVFTAANTAAQNTITLLSTLSIPTGTIIQGLTSGSGAPLTNLVTIDGGGSASNFPMFTVDSGVTAGISSLNISNGHIASQGGAIQNAGTLTLTGDTFANNYAGGYVANAGNGGGAIFSTGTLTIADTTFSGNQSAPGGAIALSGGTATVSNSTFANNEALSTYAGGAIFINSGATLTASNSTFYGNSADGGGALIDYGTLTLTNTIVANNSGDGIYSAGTLTVTNSLLAGNTGGNCVVGSGPCPANGTNGNIIGGSANLASLGNYGGPTQTVIPLPGSPALCAGSAGGIAPDAQDQRGFLRLNTTYTGYSSSAPCVDMGAVQTNYQSAQFNHATFTATQGKPVSTPAVPVVSVTENGQNLGGIPVTLTVASGTASNLTGLGPVTTVADTGAAFSSLMASAPGSYTLDATISVVGSDSIAASASLTVNSSQATHFLVSAPATVNVGQPTVIFITAEDASGNTATGYSGTVHLTSSDPFFVNLTGDTTLTNGQGTFAVTLGTAGTQIITATDTVNSSITGVSGPITVVPGVATRFLVAAPASVDAGGSFSLTVTALDFYSNVATGYTGTVHFTSTDPAAILPADGALIGGVGTFPATLNTVGNQTFTVTDSVNLALAGTSGNIQVSVPAFVVNTAGDDAGGVAANCTSSPEGTCTLRDAVAAANAAGSGQITFSLPSPSTIVLSSGALQLTSGTTVTGPGTSALILDGDQQGNILQVEAGSTTTVAGLTMQNALGTGAQLGGAIYNAGRLTLNAVVVQNSQPSGYSGGGGIYNDATGALVVNNSTIAGNGSSYFGGSSGQGGGILNQGGVVTLNASTLSTNGASLGGGNLCTNGGTVTVNSSTITASFGTSGGGGIAAGGGAVSITNSTISGNNAQSNAGVEIGGGATVTVTGSIVAGNGGAASTGNCPGCAFAGKNVVDVNPQLTPLGNFGGPTQSMIPLPGSPAICEQTSASGGATDQRGLPRTTTYSGAVCQDSGSVQTSFSMAFTADPPSSVVVNAPFTAAVTLSESGAPLPAGAVAIPLTLNATAGTLSNGIAYTLTGVANYADLEVSAPGAGDSLTANLPLTAAGAAASVALSATSSQFQITTEPTTTAAANASATFSPGAQNVTLSATLTSSGGTVNAGSVTFTVKNGGTSIGTATSGTVTNGQASATVPLPAATAAGTYTILAVYKPAGAFSGSSDNTHTLTIGQASPSIAWGAASSIGYGASLAAILDASASYNNSTVQGSFTYTAQKSGGSPSPVTAATVPGAGTYTLTAAFTPADSVDYKSATATSQLTVTPATLTITANNATRVYGAANPSFTGTVSGALNGDTFTENFTTTATLTSNAGAYAIVPSVTGANVSNYTVVAANGVLTVTQAASTTTLSVSSTAITPQQAVTLTAKVASSTTGTPTGTVSFYDGTTLLLAAPVTAGTATCTTTFAAATTNVITAVYSGDIDFTGSTAGSSATITVSSLAFTLTIGGPTPASVVPGGTVTYQATVSPTYGSYAGTVNFSAAGLPAGATAAFSPSSIPANGGTQNVTVTVSVASSQAASQPPSVGSRLAPAALALLFLPFAGRLRRHRRRLRVLACILLLALGGLAALTGLMGCGSPNGYFDRAPKAYTVTITATAGSTSQTATTTLNVQ